MSDQLFFVKSTIANVYHFVLIRSENSGTNDGAPDRGGVRKSTASNRSNTMSDSLLGLLEALTTLIGFLGSVGG